MKGIVGGFMAGNCHKKGFEQGPWYEVKCVKNTIALKEAKGLDTTFERDLLKAWAKYPDYVNHI
jgi:hypothetical protein